MSKNINIVGQVITIANQKGGCGKSTSTTFFANALHSKGYKVLLIDSDYQRSIFKMREAELENDESIDTDKLYPVRYYPANQVGEVIEKEQENYDFIFCDIPGNITDKSVIGILSMTDLLVILHDANSVGIASTLDFIENVKTGVIDIVTKLGFDPPKVVNLIARLNENLRLHKMFLNAKENVSEFPWFEHHIRDLQSTFGDMSTIYPYNHSKYNYEFDLIINELLDFLKP